MILTTFLRFLFLVSLLFWQGGFMFYGGVVVPVGGAILGSETEQGFITQSVTNYLNLAGAVCLLFWLAELWTSRKAGLLKIEWAFWLLNAFSMAVLVIAHHIMDQTLNSANSSITNPKTFDQLHKVYIGTSSIQWALSRCMLLLMLLRWGRTAHPYVGQS